MPSLSYTIPPPVGGINDRDSVDVMNESDAIRMTNMFPDNGVVKLRNGYRAHATGLGGSVQTLTEFTSAAGSRKLVGAANGKLWDCTSSGAATQLATGFTVNYWQTVVFKNTLIMVNGTDQPQKYDGSSVSDATYTGSGLADNDLISVNVYKNRLYFVEKNSTSVWYSTNVEEITGTLTELDVGSVFRKGGYVIWAGSLSRETGSGQQDLLIIASNLGEILAYTGSYPGDTEFTLVGHYFFPLILGRRAFINIGSDLAVITQGGVIPISEAIKDNQTGENYSTISDKIRAGFRQAAQVYKGNTGWEARNYPQGDLLLINVPTASNSLAFQFVLNTRTGAWTKFTQLNAICWSLLNENLYFGASDGKVYQADYGGNDNGAAIPMDMKTAFNYCGDRTRIKQFMLAKPLILGDSSHMFYMNVDVDFADRPLSSSVLTTGTTGSAWDTSEWDTAEWDSNQRVSLNWYAVSGLGRCVALRIQGLFKNAPFSLSAVQMIYKQGGYI